MSFNNLVILKLHYSEVCYNEVNLVPALGLMSM